MHRILPALLTAALAITLCGCGGSDYGDINEVETQATQTAETSAPAKSSAFNPQDAKLKYDWKRIDIGRASLSLPRLLAHRKGNGL